jgi:hypothetical protein
MCRVGVKYGSGSIGLGRGDNLAHWYIVFTGAVLGSLGASKVVAQREKGIIWQYVWTKQINGPRTDVL